MGASMSSKKARRKERLEQERARGISRRGVSPVTLFIVGVGLAVLLTIVVSFGLGDRSDRGESPWPGAVWSAAHDHWH